MIGALIIVFREVIEAGIVVGIVLAVTHGIPRRKLRIAIGVAAGVSGAFLVAIFAEALANALQGIGQEIFNGSILRSPCDADLAQCLDGEPRPADGGRNATDRRRR